MGYSWKFIQYTNRTATKRKFGFDMKKEEPWSDN